MVIISRCFIFTFMDLLFLLPLLPVTSCCDPKQRDERRGIGAGNAEDTQAQQRVARSNSITSVATIGEAGARTDDGGMDQGRSVTPYDINEYGG